MSECILFDCDGTLVDSERLCNIGLVIKFRELGIELDADELVIRFRGCKLAVIIEALADECQIVLADDFVASYRSIVAELFESELKPIEGIEDALRNIAQVKAVVSSGPVAKIQQALRVCGLSHHFGSNIYSSYDVKIWKPDPRIYEYAAKDMGFSAQNCIVVDDSLIGVEASYKAGMKTLFYNPCNEICDYSSVVSFSNMKTLAQLISTYTSQ